jgi:general secretion pathway protein D
MIRTPLAASIAPLVIGSILTQPASMWAQQLSGGSTEAAANRELARRMQRAEVIGVDETALGQAALRKKDYEDAYAHYKNACDSIPPGAPAVAKQRKAAVDGFTTAGLRLAEQRVTEGYYASAVQALQEVLHQNPDDRAVLRLLSNIEAPDYFNKQMTPQFRAKVEEVKQDFVAAQGYKDLGRFNLADRKYEEILNKDPYNIAAQKGRQEVAILKDRYAMAAYDTTRAIAMWEVDREWARPYRRFDRKTVDIQVEGKSNAPSIVQITNRLNSIRFPKIDFRDSTVREAIEFLVSKSKTLDPEGQGVDIVLKLGDEGGGSPPPPPPAAAPGGGIPGIPGLPGVPGAPGDPAGIPQMSGGGGTKITLTLNNVPMIEVIKYITNLANLKMKIEPYAVQIVPLGTEVNELFIKQWKVSPSLLRTGPGAGGGGGGALGGGGGLGAPPDAGGGSGLAATSTAKDFLLAQGVVFPQGTFAMYSPASSALVVKNTQDQLDLVERIIEIADVAGVIKQVEIQAKFVEITQNNTKELSFDWLLGGTNIGGNTNVFYGGGTSGTGQATSQINYPFTIQPGDQPLTAGNRTGQLAVSQSAIDSLLFGIPGSSLVAPGIASVVGAGTDPTFQVVMRGLNQKKGVDLLSAPRVTTKSGQRAVIEIIREFRYPTEFSQPQIPQQFGGNQQGGANFLGGGGGSNGSFPVTPTTPTAFEKRDVGVTLEVEPTIGPDGYSVDMQLVPQVVEFEGFINYGSPIQTTSQNPITGITTTNILTPNIINQPIFSTRKVTTNVTVFDGATVVLGGLVREDVQKIEDRTPILGDIPLVGRLFRSNVDSHIKRNLVIFVTARLINPEGAPIISDDEKEEAVDALPLPEIAPPLPSGKGYRPLQTSAPNPYSSNPSSGALNPAARRTGNTVY